MVKFFFTKYTASDDFSDLPRRADSKNPILIFCRILGPGHLRGPGVSLSRNFGGRASIELLGGESSQGAVWTTAQPPLPPPLDLKPPVGDPLSQPPSSMPHFPPVCLRPCPCPSPTPASGPQVLGRARLQRLRGRLLGHGLHGAVRLQRPRPLRVAGRGVRVLPGRPPRVLGRGALRGLHRRVPGARVPRAQRGHLPPAGDARDHAAGGGGGAQHHRVGRGPPAAVHRRAATAGDGHRPQRDRGAVLGGRGHQVERSPTRRACLPLPIRRDPLLCCYPLLLSDAVSSGSSPWEGVAHCKYDGEGRVPGYTGQRAWSVREKRTQGAHRALCARCAKRRLCSTAGSHGSWGPEFHTPDAVLNGSCTLL